MCHNVATRGRFGRASWSIRLLVAMAVATPSLTSQTLLDWRHAGGYTVDRDLAGPAGGRIDAVWFSGNRIVVRTATGHQFQTADLETWQPSSAVEPRRVPGILDNRGRMPESGSQLKLDHEDRGSLYALGNNAYRSRDGGVSWESLTGYHSQPVIGGAIRDLAIAPDSPDHIVVANDFGIWHSTDSGLSWSSLNAGLPNLPATALLAPARGSPLPRLVVNGTVAQLSADRERWLGSQSVDENEAQRARAAATLKQDVTALASAGEVAIAGTIEGRLWYSSDRGVSYSESRGAVIGARIERVYVMPDEPRIALAITAGHVLQTFDGGVVWNDMTGNLPEGKLYGVTGEREGGAVYVGGEKGVFWAKADLNAAVSTATWTPISAGLPVSPVRAVRLENGGNQLYVALEGYGVYSARAPHKARAWRLLNAADLSGRAAAPGSLLTLQGGKVDFARAGALQVPVLAAAADSSQIQVPFEVTGSSISLNVQADTRHMTFDFPVKSHSPAIFVDPDGAPVFVDADTGLTLDAANHARANSRVQVLTTGLGRVRPNFPAGQVAPVQNPPAVAADVKAFLDGVEVRVTRATLAPGYVGCYMVEVEIPQIVNAGPAEFYISADGETSNKVSLHLSQ